MVLGLIASTVAFAHSKAQLDTGATRAMRHFYTLNPMNRELADRAAGILIFARVTKGVAGEYGEGVLRLSGETADYYSVKSASIGLTLGASEHSEIIMFMTQAALSEFLNSEASWSVGADTALALVSKGAAGQYNSDTLSKPVLGFVFGEKGLLGDLSLQGSKITRIKITS